MTDQPKTCPKCRAAGRMGALYARVEYDCGTHAWFTGRVDEGRECKDRQIVGLQTERTNLLDTIRACLVAAGGSGGIGALELQVSEVGTKPSDFVRAQMALLRNEISDAATLAYNTIWDRTQETIEADQSCGLCEILARQARRNRAMYDAAVAEVAALRKQLHPPVLDAPDGT